MLEWVPARFAVMRVRMARSIRAAVIVAVVGAIGAWSPGAAAYEWYKTQGGEPMRWFGSALTYRIANVAPGEVALSELPGLFDEAFGAWMDLPGCKVPEVAYAGPVEVTRATPPASVDEAADNVMVFIPDAAAWRASGHSPTWIAITLVANDTLTGEIIDADMEVNDGGYAFSTGDTVAQGQIDLPSTLIHEAGHFFGMEHSLSPTATMYALYSGADSADKMAARSLEADDKDGVCALYMTLPPCPEGCDDGDACTTDTCVDDRCVFTAVKGCGGSGGCDAAHGDSGEGGRLALGLGLGLALVVARRRLGSRPALR